MASRKDQKEQARAARIAKEQGAAARAQRTRRLQIFGGVTVIAVIVIVVAIVVSSGGGTKNAPPKTGAQTAKVVAVVNKEFKGIPQNGSTLGNPKAKITMTYFGDLQCPICQEFTLNTFPQFVQDQVRTNKVKVIYRSYCTATCNGKLGAAGNQKMFDSQQVAALAAGKQNKFWQYTDLFYHEQEEEGTGYATSSWLTNLAHQVTGLKVPAWTTDRTDPALLDSVNADLSYANKASLPGTPSLIMKGPKGEELVDNGNLPSYSDLAAAVKTVS